MTVPVARRAARVLLIDASRRVLLFRGGDPSAPEAGTWWFTPGGGLDEGETHAEAAARELLEETGLRITPDALGEPVLDHEVEFAFDGTTYAQSQQFFVARVDAHEVDTSGFSPLEHASVVEHRWWPLQELAQTRDRVYPVELVELLTRLGV
jgi:8-oxo-dGTP pyrophosphatase MutT (NUDIX family)